MAIKTHGSKHQTFWTVIKKHPPIPIILICIFEIIGILLLPAAIVSEKSLALGLWYQIYVALTGALSVAIIYSLWKMKKIGILIYVGSYAYTILLRSLLEIG